MPPGMGVFPAPVTPIQSPIDDDVALKEQMLKASQLGQQSYGAATGAMSDLAGKIQALQQQQTAEPMPKPWSPQYEPVTGAGSFLRDAGKGILQALSLTGPGRTVENAMYQRQMAPYEQKQTMRAQQISDLQKEMEAEATTLSPAAQLQYRPYMASAAGTRAEAAMLNANNKRLHDVAMERLKAKFQDIQQQLGQGKLTQEQARTEVMKEIAAQHDATIQGIADTSSDQRDRDAQMQAFENEYKVGSDHLLQSFFGVGPTPPSRQTAPPPGPKATGTGVKPAAQAQHKPGGSAGGLPEGQSGTGSDGRKYVVKGGKWVAQ